MTGIIFSFKEGIKGFKRAKLSSFVSIFAIFISLSALGIFTLLTLRLQKILNEIKNKVELEAVIDEKFGESEIKRLTGEIKNIEGVEYVEFISKEKAAKRFQESFGENISELYGDNPLPISFIIKVKKEFLNKESMDKIVSKIENFNGITETIFKRELLLKIDRYWKIFRIADLTGGILIALGSIFIISNTIKITIYAKSKTIEIMKLIGATDSFIKKPFLFEGLTQGIIGGIFSCIFIYLLAKSLAFFLEISVEIGANLYLAVVFSGAFLGYIGYLWSVKKFLS